jgi:hypothetical protein
MVVEAGHYTFPDGSSYDAGFVDGVNDAFTSVEFMSSVPDAVVFS